MIVDIHSHIYPRSYINLLAERTAIPRIEIKDDGEHFVIFPNEDALAGGTRSIGPEYFDLNEKLVFMDKHGISKTVVSLGNPWIDFLSRQEAPAWASKINDEITEITEEYDKFAGLAVLPLQDVRAAVEEMKRIESLPHILGVSLGTRPNGVHLDDPYLNPFWEQAEAQQLPVYIHPHYAIGLDWMSGYGHAMPLALGFTFETATAVTRLILGGVMDRFPFLKIILAHSGGTLPFLAGRLAVCTKADPLSSKNMKMPFGDYLRKFYYDAITYSSVSLKVIVEIAGCERLFFGTDHPFGIADPDCTKAALIEAIPSETDRQAVLAGNAEKWILTKRIG
jgi:aminocarboxymuconate-semialdehyde decarboxylase